MTIHVRDAQTGRPVEDVGRSHEAWIHLIVTRDDLGAFQHIHPTPTGEPGTFAVPITFPTAGRYTLHAEFKRVAQMADVVAVGHAVVGNPATVPAEPVRESGRVQVLDGVRVELAGEAEAGHRSRLTYRFTDAATGAPITTLRPYLAAAGHIAILREDGTAFAHEHAEVEDADGNPVFALPGQELRPRARRPRALPPRRALPALGPVPHRGRHPPDHAVHRPRLLTSQSNDQGKVGGS